MTLPARETAIARQRAIKSQYGRVATLASSVRSLVVAAWPLAWPPGGRRGPHAGLALPERRRPVQNAPGPSGRLLASIMVLPALLTLGAGLLMARLQPHRTQMEPPEARIIAQVQDQVPFTILIPAYLPEGLQRDKATLVSTFAGPGSIRQVDITYKDDRGGQLVVRQWVPTDPEKEIPAQSPFIQTRWGKGALSAESGIMVLWVDVGQTRASVFGPTGSRVTAQQLVQVAESLGPWDSPLPGKALSASE